MVCAMCRKFRSSQKSAVSDLCLSIPTCFKTRNTSTDPLVILIPISGAELWIISSSVLPLPTLLAAATSRLGSPTVRIILALKAFARELRGLKEVHAALRPGQRLLIEYKPFEPAFYHTDIADWGMALALARNAGPQALVLVDTGHHYQSQNIEQIVAWLLHQDMLGGFHFNDRRYADDDLTLGSIDPYQVFRIFHELLVQEWETGTAPDTAFM